MTQLEQDARRYRRLRVLGAAPFGSPQLVNGTVMRFTNLDAFIDADIARQPSRGEANIAGETDDCGSGNQDASAERA